MKSSLLTCHIPHSPTTNRHRSWNIPKNIEWNIFQCTIFLSNKTDENWLAKELKTKIGNFPSIDIFYWNEYGWRKFNLNYNQLLKNNYFGFQRINFAILIHIDIPLLIKADNWFEFDAHVMCADYRHSIYEWCFYMIMDQFLTFPFCAKQRHIVRIILFLL